MEAGEENLEEYASRVADILQSDLGLEEIDVISKDNSGFSRISFRDYGDLYEATFFSENGGYSAILERRTSDTNLLEDDGEVREFRFYGTTEYETARGIREILET